MAAAEQKKVEAVFDEKTQDAASLMQFALEARAFICRMLMRQRASVMFARLPFYVLFGSPRSTPKSAHPRKSA